MNSSTPKKSVRPTFSIIMAGVAALALVLVWSLRTPSQPAATETASEVAEQPAEATAAPAARSSGKSARFLNAVSKAGPEGGTVRMPSTLGGSAPTADAAPSVSLVTADGSPSAHYAEQVAILTERVDAGVSANGVSTVGITDAAEVVQRGAAGAGTAAAGAVAGTGAGVKDTGVDGYRRADQSRRALVEAMKPLRRALIQEANRGADTN